MTTLADTIALLEARRSGAATSGEMLAALHALSWALRVVDIRRAHALSGEAVALARSAGSPADLASALCLHGGCASGLALHGDAETALAESLALSRQLGERRIEARCRHFLGRGRHLRADYAGAIENITAALALAEAAGDGECAGDSLNLLGVVYLALCDYAQGLHWFKRGLEARERTGDATGIGGSLGNIGAVYSKMGEYAQSVIFHRRGLTHARQLGDLKAETICLTNLSGDWAEMGRHAEALEAGWEAAKLAERLGDDGLVGGALTNIAHACTALGRYAEAQRHYAAALAIARSCENTDCYAETLYYIGEALTRQGELGQARTRLAEAAALARTVGARKTEFQAAQGLSEVCKRLGDYAAALGHYETFRRLEKAVCSEEADKRAKALGIQMEVEHHRHEAETLAGLNAALRDSNAALHDANTRLEALATTDPLTGLPNHRALVAALDSGLARARRTGQPCALLFLDIDHFKFFNDTYGHPVGDMILREFAGCVRAALREEDILGRWGGEEFLALLPGTPLEAALLIGERVRTAVTEHAVSLGPSLHLTCSVGVSAGSPEDAGRDTLIESADRALYAAKRLGRNQVRAAADPALGQLDWACLDTEAAAGRRFDTPPPFGV